MSNHDQKNLLRDKKNLLGVLISAVDYQVTIQTVLDAARQRQSLTVSALAVHGVMTGVLDPEQQYRLNHLDLVVPDGQPVRWALNWLYHCGLKERVYGPSLMLKICDRAARLSLPIYLYGSSPEVLQALSSSLTAKFPTLKIVGTQSSRFRQISQAEQLQTVQDIQESGAAIVFVGLGCPRQETWIYEHRNLIHMPLLAVGAAFDFHAGLLAQAPKWMQKRGLEWIFRLIHEPRRLWRRYVYLNPLYVSLLILQRLRVKSFKPHVVSLPLKVIRYG